MRSAFLLATTFLTVAACSNAPEAKIPEATGPQTLSEEIMLADFDEGQKPDFVRVNNGSLKLVPSRKEGGAGHELDVKLASKDNWSGGLALAPSEPWDWSGYKDFHVAFDVSNHGTESTQIDISMADIDGNSYTRAFVIPTGGEVQTVYAKMDGHDQLHPPGTAANEFNFKSGLRSNPPTWESDDQQVYSLWGKKHLNLKGITNIYLGVSGNLSDRDFTIDNIRLRPNPEQNPDFLVGLLDEFGQNAKKDFPNKINSLDHLHEVRDAELAELKGERWEDRSKFHGWTGGPKLEATGYFRTEKVDGKWWLIDPEGHLYFSTGVDIIRLSNSSTITGYDFDPALIAPRDKANDIISEDDQPLNRVNDEAIPTRKLMNETRSKMFTWLPGYDDELGNHFGYRRETQSGPLKHGETFSFYSSNLERKYGETTERSYMDKWREVTLDRMVDWGFTTLGNWAEEEYYANQEIPFIAFADINGDFGTLSSGQDFWHPLPDAFDPKFYDRALESAKFVANQMEASPWCMGIFYDNEQSFGRPGNDRSTYGMVFETLKLDGDKSHGKAAFAKLMQEKYETIEALNTAWDMSVESWEQFNKGVEIDQLTDSQRQDFSDLLYAYGVQYFGTIRKATKEILPNHLYLGARMADWGRPDEIVRAAAENADLLSFNLYEDGFVPSHWEIMYEVDRPTLIGEFSFASDDTGHFHPGIVIAENQKDRGRKYQDFMKSILESPHMVGAHMFQYMDGPVTGRAYDGENYPTGIVSITDTPHWDFLEGVKELNKELYDYRYNYVLK